ncbi:MAG: glycosyltransferase, partial [Ardenticatenaceae bacterium]
IKMLAEAQVRRGHRVTVLVTSLTGQTRIERRNGVLVIKASRLAHVASTPLSLSLPRILARLDADVAHLQFPYPVGELAALYAARAPRIVLSYQSDIVRQVGLLRLYQPFMHRVLRRADAIIATSPPYVQSSDVLRLYQEKIHIVPLGIHTSLYGSANAIRVGALLGEWSPEGEPLILFIGRLRYYKGLDVLLRAAAQLHRGRILIVGGGPERGRLDALSARLNVTERVHFLGALSDEELLALRHAVRQSGGLFVLPATHRSEAFGLVLVEAMAAGLPLVTTELGTGTSWVNRHGETGYVVPPNDPSVLAAALDELLASPERLAAMGAAARQRAADFDISLMVDRIEDVYHKIKAGSGEGQYSRSSYKGL